MAYPRQVKGFRFKNDPLGDLVLFYLSFNNTIVPLTGQTLSSTVGTPLLSNTAPLPFGDGSQTHYLDPNGGEYIFNWSPGGLVIPATDEFTMECWSYLTAYGASGRCVFSSNDFGPSVLPFRMNVGSTGAIDCILGSSNMTSGAGVFTLNTWHHWAICKYTDGTRAGYMDGSRVIAPAAFSSNQGTPSTLRICDANNNLQQWAGKIGLIRITAAARYSGASYTVPTSLPLFP